MDKKKQLAGFLGGKKTFEKHGREHMRAIGRAGARELHARYYLSPVHLNDFALVDRGTHMIKAFLSGRPVDSPVAEGEP